MERYICLLFILVSLTCSGQALRDINYNYEYNPEEKFTFLIKPVKQIDQWKILYEFQLKDTTQRSEYSFQWEARDALNDKKGVDLVMEDRAETTNASGFTGVITLPVATAPKIVAVRVLNNLLKQAWLFYANLESNYPVNNYLLFHNEPICKPYINASTKEAVLANKKGSWIVSYYNDKFPAAAPAFSETLGKVSKALKSDSIFNITAEISETDFSKKGLYLIQRDTLIGEGFSFRTEEDYPKYSKIKNLAGPLIYICTKQEYDRLQDSNGDKKIFDRVVLSITNDAERAKKLIRNYFRRVELANQYFTSYKEGWKTDRGMVYIIFGLPDEVFKFSDREVWNYKNDYYKVSFDFTRSNSVFDPDNYVLIRDKSFRDTWYEAVDLWRNARF